MADAARVTMSSDELNIQECVRCGNCMELCPTFSEALSESMGPRGRVALLKEMESSGLSRTRPLDERIFSCMLCGACTDRCPAGVNITGAVYAGRTRLRQQPGSRELSVPLIRHAFRHAAQAFRLLRAVRGIGNWPLAQSIPALRALANLHIRPASSPLSDSGSVHRVQNARGRVAIFAGCTVGYLFPQYGHALIESLRALRYDVVVPKGEVCCGAPLLSLGFRDDAALLAERNMRLFRDLRVEAVVSLCPTCVHFLRDEYRTLLGEGMNAAMDENIFFAHHADRFRERRAGDPAIYHASCHTRHLLKSDETARRLVSAAGYDLRQCEPGCCGFGGTFSVLYEEMSSSLREKRLAAFRATDSIITSCPNCILQLQRRAETVTIRHSIEIIHESLTGAKS